LNPVIAAAALARTAPVRVQTRLRPGRELCITDPLYAKCEGYRYPEGDEPG